MQTFNLNFNYFGTSNLKIWVTDLEIPSLVVPILRLDVIRSLVATLTHLSHSLCMCVQYQFLAQAWSGPPAPISGLPNALVTLPKNRAEPRPRVEILAKFGRRREVGKQGVAQGGARWNRATPGTRQRNSAGGENPPAKFMQMRGKFKKIKGYTDLYAPLILVCF